MLVIVLLIYSISALANILYGSNKNSFWTLVSTIISSEPYYKVLIVGSYSVKF